MGTGLVGKVLLQPSTPDGSADRHQHGLARIARGFDHVDVADLSVTGDDLLAPVPQGEISPSQDHTVGACR